jgi:uncharacterized peroxidase-related enzyme
MSRLEHLPREELDALGEELDALSQANGYTANSFLIMGRRPEIARNVLILIRSIMRNPDSTIDADLRWLVAYMCSYAHGCQYCQAHTLKNGTTYGLPQAKIDAIWEYETSDVFSDGERAALRIAQLGGMSPVGVEDTDMAELRRHYSEEQVVEIVLVISLFGFNNRWNAIMNTDLEPKVRDFMAGNPRLYEG